MKFKVAVSSLMIASLMLAGAPSDNKGGVELLIQKARSLEGRGRADLAAQVWQQVLIVNPDQADALAGLVRWAKQSGKTDEANSLMVKLRRVDPNSVALSEIENGDPSRKQSSRLNEAAKLAAAQRFDAAMQIYRDVFGSNPPPGGWALAYYETEAQTDGGLDSAIAGLRKLAHDYPEVGDYTVTLGRILTYRSTTRQAGIAELSTLNGTSPAALKAKQAWHQALLWERANAAYLPAVRNYLSRYPDTELQNIADGLSKETTAHATAPSAVAEQRGYAALQKADLPEAKKHFTAALADSPHDSQAFAGLGFTHMKEGDFAAAVADFEKAKKLAPKAANLSEAYDNAKFWNAMQEGTHSVEPAKAVGAFSEALAIRKDDADALRALAGAYMRMNQPGNAAPYFEHLTQVRSQDAEAWKSLLQAKYSSEGAKAASEEMQKVPPPMLRDLSGKPEFKILLATIYSETDRLKLADELLSELTAFGTDRLAPDVQVQVANLQIKCHRATAAEASMRHLLVAHPDHLGAWSTLISACIASDHVQAAETAMDQMPAALQDSALHDSGFLLLMAGVRETAGNLNGAKLYLDRVLQLPDTAADENVKLEAKIQLASVLSRTGAKSEAADMLDGIVSLHPERANAWKVYLSLLQSVGQYGQLLSFSARMPDSVASQLRGDADVVSLWADAEVKTGHPEAGSRLLEGYLSRPGTGGKQVSTRLQMQLCWMLLNRPERAGDLYSRLTQLHNGPDLDSAQRVEVDNIWTTWILRSANTATKSGNLVRAQTVLAEGVSEFPQNPKLQSALAGSYLQGHDEKRAFALYSNWGLTGASPADYAGAIGAALNQNNPRYADAWLEKALNQWPTDPLLLTLAGDRARTKGDVKKAKQLWHEALVAKQTLPDPTPTESTVASASSLRALLVGNSDSGAASGRTGSAAFVSSADGDLRATPAEGPGSNETGPDVHLSRFDLTPSSSQDFVPAVRQAALPSEQSGVAGYRTPAPVGSQSLVGEASNASAPESLEDKLAKLDNRNSPFFNAGTTVQSRSGQGGFDRLLIEQADIEASTTIADQMRVSLIAKPTFLDGGTPSSNSTVRLGSAPLGSPFAIQTASGVAAETQISSDSFGLRFGMSPNGFLVRNVLGGIRYQPGDGPVTFLLERDDVKDTLLSYAGTRDPISGQIFGGVVSTGGSVLGHWGSDRSGIYASLGYQSITGRAVAANDATNGNFGVYWKAYAGPTGNLTLGLNFSGMHYDKNLRYFTSGQGGYFSPQQYFLFGMPFRYTGTYQRRLQYSVGGSIGAQHFQEDSSDYFPVDAALQASKEGGMYPAFQSTGANFSFDSKISYQINPQLFLGAYLTANNSRNYVSSGAGLFIKYSFEPRPNALDQPVKSVPDWRGQQPFTLF